MLLNEKTLVEKENKDGIKKAIGKLLLKSRYSTGVSFWSVVDFISTFLFSQQSFFIGLLLQGQMLPPFSVKLHEANSSAQ